MHALADPLADEPADDAIAALRARIARLRANHHRALENSELFRARILAASIATSEYELAWRINARAADGHGPHSLDDAITITRMTRLLRDTPAAKLDNRYNVFIILRLTGFDRADVIRLADAAVASEKIRRQVMCDQAVGSPQSGGVAG